jgi:hypothetical protein
MRKWGAAKVHIVLPSICLEGQNDSASVLRTAIPTMHHVTGERTLRNEGLRLLPDRDAITDGTIPKVEE